MFQYCFGLLRFLLLFLCFFTFSMLCVCEFSKHHLRYAHYRLYSTILIETRKNYPNDTTEQHLNLYYILFNAPQIGRIDSRARDSTALFACVLCKLIGNNTLARTRDNQYDFYYVRLFFVCCFQWSEISIIAACCRHRSYYFLLARRVCVRIEVFEYTIRAFVCGW